MARVLVAARAHVGEAVQHGLVIQNAVRVNEVFDQLPIVRERRRSLRTWLRSRARRGKNDRGAKCRADCDEDANSQSRHIASSTRRGVSVSLDDFSTGTRYYT